MWFIDTEIQDRSREVLEAVASALPEGVEAQVVSLSIMPGRPLNIEMLFVDETIYGPTYDGHRQQLNTNQGE